LETVPTVVHGAVLVSRGAAKEYSPRREPWDRTRKQSSSEGAKAPHDPSPDNVEEYELIKQAEAAIPGAMAGNWRDLRHRIRIRGNQRAQQRSHYGF
jgi:hypothetical protein